MISPFDGLVNISESCWSIPGGGGRGGLEDMLLGRGGRGGAHSSKRKIFYIPSDHIIYLLHPNPLYFPGTIKWVNFLSRLDYNKPDDPICIIYFNILNILNIEYWILNIEYWILMCTNGIKTPAICVWSRIVTFWDWVEIFILYLVRSRSWLIMSLELLLEHNWTRLQNPIAISSDSIS